jgi:hypothetical protein
MRFGGSKSRVALVDALMFPAGVRYALSDLTFEQISTAETAARQWFRLAARHPKATMSMPSVAVDKLWLAFSRHEREYGEFCRSAVGRAYPYTSQRGALAATYRFAREDEPGDRLPLLFRLDKELVVTGGRSYIADCGGRGQCFDVKDAICLQHLTGVGRATKRNGMTGPGASADGLTYGAGGGAGCGGGCGGT